MFRNRKNGLKFTIFVLAVIMFSAFGTSWADDIIEAITEGLEYYKEGDFGEAVGSLDYAAQLIRQKRASKLEAFLPATLPGWKAKDVESQASGQAIFGGMVSAKREYRKGSSSVTVDIVADSPILQSMVMMFSNPAFAAADGGRLRKIKRQKAIVKYRSSNQEGEITIVVDKRYLVSIKGRKVSEEALVNYASAIDYKKLKKF